MSYYRKSLVGNTTRVIRHDGVKATVKYFEEVMSRDLVFAKESVTVYNMTIEETLLAFNLPVVGKKCQRRVTKEAVVHMSQLLRELLSDNKGTNSSDNIDEILQSWNGSN